MIEWTGKGGVSALVVLEVQGQNGKWIFFQGRVEELRQKVGEFFLF